MVWLNLAHNSVGTWGTVKPNPQGCILLGAQTLQPG